METPSTNVKEEVRYKGLIDCAMKIYKNEGILAFYKGLTPNLIRIFPASGLFFLTYETTLKCLSFNGGFVD